MPRAKTPTTEEPQAKSRPETDQLVPDRLRHYLALADNTFADVVHPKPMGVTGVQPVFHPPKPPRLQSPKLPARPKAPKLPKFAMPKPPTRPKTPKFSTLPKRKQR